MEFAMHFVSRESYKVVKRGHYMRRLIQISTYLLQHQLRLDTSHAPARVLMSILVGILVGNLTRGSESPLPTDPGGSKFEF